ncbi:hypothetical protein [Salinarimonas rosea]|uniref:hypothetical protein n=1 Tax=Salinarimonas rosea TaxID=552063 RepID=UPI0012EC8FFC|nr:hypothetical protein [Salinarimonas rosea]
MSVIDLASRPELAAHAGRTLGLLRAHLAGMDLACPCRERLEDALTRLSRFEEMRSRRLILAAAREERERIGLLLGLLAELDDLAPGEPDETVYRELELLFRDVAAAAERGALALARASGAAV